MSKKMKIIPSIFKNKEAKHQWQWPSCKHPKTLSFRVNGVDDDLFPTTLPNGYELHEESLTTTTKYSSNYTSFSTIDDELSDKAALSLEVVMSGARTSERLFFEPEETSSIVKHSKNGKSSSPQPFKDSVAMAMESDDPYLDFKKSMEEMVESQGLLKDWDCLEELLLWYLKMNGKMNHRFIVGAFVDLLVGFADVDSKKKKKKTMMASSGSTTTTIYSTASSSFSSPSSPLSPHSSLVDN